MAHASGQPPVLDLSTLGVQLTNTLLRLIPPKPFWGKEPSYAENETQAAFEVFLRGVRLINPMPAPSEVLFTIENIQKEITQVKRWPYHLNRFDWQARVILSRYDAHFHGGPHKEKVIVEFELSYVSIIQAGKQRENDLRCGTSGGTYALMPVDSRIFSALVAGNIDATNRDQVDRLKRIQSNLKKFDEFFARETTTAAECQRALDYLQSPQCIQTLATDTAFTDFLKENAQALYTQIMSPGAVDVALRAAEPTHSEASPIHGISAGGWYHNKASDRDMQCSGLWDEVIRYSTMATPDAERQRMLSIEAAQALNRLATDPSAEVPATFAELLRRVLAPQAVKSDGAGASEKTDVASAIVIDREGELVDDHPEFRAQLSPLSEAELSNISRNLSRMQQDLQAESAHQPFRQAFTRAYLALPTRIEKLMRINGYARYKVREAKAEALYGEYRRILNPPSTEALPPRFFDFLTHLETGSLLEQDGTLRQLEINLRQFAVFLEKETTPEDQRLFLRAYLQRETVISTLAQSRSFADFQTALGLRPTAPPKSAMRNEPAAVFAPAAASAPPVPIANEIPPLQASLAAKGGRGDQINAAQGAFLIADALNMPLAPTGELSAASAPPLPADEGRKEPVKEPVLG